MSSLRSGAVLATPLAIVEWYVHAKDKPSIIYFEGPTMSFANARAGGHEAVIAVADALDKLADQGRIVLVHQRMVDDVLDCCYDRYMAQRVPVSRMKDNHRRERWAYNLERP